jgi:hypothetical protein
MESSCVICGRTILAGERVHRYLIETDEQSVCELCLSRAEQFGWRPAEAPEPEREQRRSHERRWRLGGLLRSRPPAPAAPRRQPPPPVEEDGLTPFQRAVVRFNSSEAGRAVSGLTRTLGSPKASVGASAGAPAEIRITVAWELSWYQWGIDLDDELRPAIELDKGSEIEQLDAAAKQWNAAVGKDGKLRLAGEPATSR